MVTGFGLTSDHHQTDLSEVGAETLSMWQQIGFIMISCKIETSHQ